MSPNRAILKKAVNFICENNVEGLRWIKTKLSKELINKEVQSRTTVGENMYMTNCSLFMHACSAGNYEMARIVASVPNVDVNIGITIWDYFYPIGSTSNPLIIKLIALHPSFNPKDDEYTASSYHYEILKYGSGISLKKFNHDTNPFQITAFIPLLRIMFPTLVENVLMNNELLYQLSELEREELQVIVDVLLYDSIEVLPDNLDEQESSIFERKLALLFILDQVEQNELTQWKNVLLEGLNMQYLESFNFTEKAKEKVDYYLENFKCGVYLNRLQQQMISTTVSETETEIEENEIVTNPLWKLFENQSETDIDIPIASEDGSTSFIVKCHKTVLQSKSMFFEAFLSTENGTWSESEIFPYETLFLIHFMYGKENLEIPQENLLNVMKKAHEHGLFDLIEYCAEKIEISSEEEAIRLYEILSEYVEEPIFNSTIVPKLAQYSKSIPCKFL